MPKFLSAAKVLQVLAMGLFFQTKAASFSESGKGLRSKSGRNNSCKIEVSDYSQLLDKSDDRISMVIGVDRKTHALQEKVRLQQGPVLTIAAGGCDDLSLNLFWDSLPDGGAAKPPMFRMTNMIYNVPTKNTQIKEILQLMAAASSEISRSEELRGKERSYSVSCGMSQCKFSWKRAPNGALTLTALYGSEL